MLARFEGVSTYASIKNIGLNIKSLRKIEQRNDTSKACLYVFVGYSKILYILHFVHALELSTLHFTMVPCVKIVLFVNHMLLFSFTLHHFLFCSASYGHHQMSFYLYYMLLIMDR